MTSFVEQSILPLISGQFPSFYQSEGPSFIAFTKAYYEWLESNFQLLTFEDDTGFAVGQKIQQGSVTGSIYAKIDDSWLVYVDTFDTFRCFNACSDLTPVTTIDSDGVTHTTLITKGGTTRRYGSLFHARNLQKYRDIDSTMDLFVVKFKEKYLKNIEFDTKTNQRLLIKRATELYRAKGTERAVDLFFRLIYGVNAEVIYPGDFVFKLSDGDWYVPRYIEISADTIERAVDLVGKEITGARSGAKAFVEKYAKIQTDNGYSHVLYVTGIGGEFEISERLIADRLYDDSPSVLGSLTNAVVLNGGRDFVVGDIVDVETSTGKRGKARIAAVESASGAVAFELIDGGFGYTETLDPVDPSDSDILISNSIFTLSNVVVGNTITGLTVFSPGSFYSNTDTIRIPTDGIHAEIQVITNSSGGIVGGDVRVPGSGIFADTATLPYTITANNGDPSFGVGGTVGFTVSRPGSYFTLLEPLSQGTSEATIVGISDHLVVESTRITGSITQDDVVRQRDDSGHETFRATVVRTVPFGLGGTVTLTASTGTIDPTLPITKVGSDTLDFFTVLQVSIDVGVTSQDTFNNSPVYTKFTGIRSDITRVSSGTGARFEVGSITNKKQVKLNTDYLSNTAMLDVVLNNTGVPFLQGGGFSPDGILFNGMNFVEKEVGIVESLSSFSPGINYNADPFVTLIHREIAALSKHDYILTLANETQGFIPGELITQTTESPSFFVEIADEGPFPLGSLVDLVGDSGIIASGYIRQKIAANNTLVVEQISGSGTGVGLELRLVSNTDISQAPVDTLFTTLPYTVEGLIQYVSGDDVGVRRLDIDREFTDLAEVRSGAASAAVAVVSYRTNLPVSGLNARVFADARTSDGRATSVQIVDSGFGFKAGQTATATGTSERVATLLVQTGGQGTGSGEYRNKRGFLSDLAKIHDGDYYQEYSYDVLSKIPFDKYKQTLIKSLHTSGTRVFGTSVIDSATGNIDQTNFVLDLVSSNTAPTALHSVKTINYPRIPTSTTRNFTVPVTDYRRINIHLR